MIVILVGPPLAWPPLDRWDALILLFSCSCGWVYAYWFMRLPNRGRGLSPLERFYFHWTQRIRRAYLWARHSPKPPTGDSHGRPPQAP